ncbi:hypothetical protein BOSEA31B_10426 [Hyphomicrobiales bacterium]|nr:hypothetical protein BOSEA31B_10426 [Hyphomicrobiales bacterium]CAH1702108.1 hypothetical protein BOSEA1005_21807 [Hyphomicrobiales bacterium]CAI0346264.1 hypothetical protein BO1005MUT1_490076 [Hyphomicrobiales bacterium]
MTVQIWTIIKPAEIGLVVVLPRQQAAADYAPQLINNGAI